MHSMMYSFLSYLSSAIWLLKVDFRAEMQLAWVKWNLLSFKRGTLEPIIFWKFKENTVVCALKVGIFHISRRFETHQFKILMVPLVLTNLHHHCRQWEATEAYEIKVTLLEFKVLPWRSWHYKDIHKKIFDFSVVQC